MSLAPVAERERIQSLDAMRGLAVLGILAVNAAFFAAPWQAGINPSLPPLAVTDETLWAWLVMHVFFEQKFITLFSILFGASIYMVGGERSDRERGAVLRRRLSWLLVFGLVHALLIWFGDILVTYALTGFLVMLARSWRGRTLLIVGAVLLSVAVGLQAAFGLAYDSIPGEQIAEIKTRMWTPGEAEIARIIAAYQGGWPTALQENVQIWVKFFLSSEIVTILRTAGVMMIGMALFKWGFLSGNARVWSYLLMLGLGVVSLALVAWQAWVNARTGFDFEHMQRHGVLANAALSIFVSIGYASLFVLLVKAGAWFVTVPLAAVGRMAFTNYIAQSLIMTTIFWGGRGFGLYGELDRSTLWGIVLAIWALQLIWSPLWFSAFKLGPLEWVWRRLSYGQPIGFAKEKTA